MSPDGQSLLLRGERGLSDELRRVNLELPMGDGPTTNCPRCAPDPERTERIIEALMEGARGCEHPADARELLAMALAWYRTLPETPDMVELPA